MKTLNVYLAYEGNCFEAFEFYKSVLGGDFSHVARFGEMPPESCPEPIPESEKDKIMHVSLPISKETVLMGSDTSEAFGNKVNFGNNFSLSLNVDTKEEADRIFNELSVGGQVSMPMANTFWGSYFGMFSDKFGISWMVSVESKEHK